MKLTMNNNLCIAIYHTTNIGTYEAINLCNVEINFVLFKIIVLNGCHFSNY